MSIVTTINYDTPGNFTFDATKIEFSGVTARLLDLRPADALFYADYGTNENGNWGGGTLTGTLLAGAAVAGGFLDVEDATFAAGKEVKYTATSKINADKGCIRMKIRAKFAGAPGANGLIFNFANSDGSNNNKTELRHDTANAWRVDLRTDIGGVIVTNQGHSSTNFVDERDYELEYNWDFISGAQNFFVDGVKMGAGTTFTNDRSNNLTDVTHVEFGSNANIFYDSILIFDEPQHTANYTSPSTEPSATIFDLTNPTILLNAAIGADGLEGFTEIATKAAGSEIKYVMCVDGVDFYHDTSNWVVSDGTFAQANLATEVETNKAALDLSAGINLKIRTFLHSDDGSVRPIITSNTVNTNFFIAAPVAINECLIFVNLSDVLQGDLSGISNAKLFAEVSQSFQHGVKNILPSKESVAFDPNHLSGYYAEISVIETTTPNKKMDFYITFTRSGKEEQVRFRPVVIPDATSKALNTITTVAVQ